jgi:predicted lipoprotein with Yx(FWY)xxD motif
MKRDLKTRRRITRGASTRTAAALIVAGSLATALGVTSASGALHSHAKSVVISSLKSAQFGTVLTDGTTLYTLKANATKCTATCHKYWIEVLLPKGVTKATASHGVNQARLGTLKVAGGLQVTYGGKSLYWFFLDKSPGQVKGNVTDTWGKWADVVLAKPASKPTTTTTIAKGAPPTTTTVPATTTTTTAPSGGGGGGGVGF